jgi:hypothetical protein
LDCIAQRIYEINVEEWKNKFTKPEIKKEKKEYKLNEK